MRLRLQISEPDRERLRAWLFDSTDEVEAPYIRAVLEAEPEPAPPDEPTEPSEADWHEAERRATEINRRVAGSAPIKRPEVPRDYAHTTRSASWPYATPSRLARGLRGILRDAGEFLSRRRLP